MNNFDEAAYGAFLEAAKEKYDFATCQRSDGSYYGTGGTCRKGSEIKGKAPSKKEKKIADMRAKDLKRRGASGENHGKQVKGSGDGGKARKEAKASGEVADRKAAARRENETKKMASARTDSKMSSARAAEIKAKFDFDRQMKKGGQDGPKATAKQKRAAKSNFQGKVDRLESKLESGKKLTASEQAELNLARAAVKANS